LSVALDDRSRTFSLSLSFSFSSLVFLSGFNDIVEFVSDDDSGDDEIEPLFRRSARCCKRIDGLPTSSNAELFADDLKMPLSERLDEGGDKAVRGGEIGGDFDAPGGDRARLGGDFAPKEDARKSFKKKKRKFKTKEPLCHFKSAIPELLPLFVLTQLKTFSFQHLPDFQQVKKDESEEKEFLRERNCESSSIYNY
jgi:hypothetical protein